MFTNYDLVDMRLMVNIADTNSVTHGAQQSNMSPPAASLRIRKLEENLAVKLFYRSVKGVKLTPAGGTFVHHARLVLQELDRLNGDLQDHVRGVKGHLRIFANTTSITEFLPEVLPKFLEMH